MTESLLDLNPEVVVHPQALLLYLQVDPLDLLTAVVTFPFDYHSYHQFFVISLHSFQPHVSLQVLVLLVYLVVGRVLLDFLG